MTRILIIDENDGARKSLFFHLNNLEEEVEITESSNFSEAIKLIHKNEYTIVFIDVKIGKNNAFELLNSIDNTHFEIVFTAIDSQLAFQAIKFNPIDFLIKPISKKEVVSVLKEVKKQHNLPTKKSDILIIKDFNKLQDQSIVIPISRGYMHLQLRDIMYIKSYGAYVKIFLEEDNPIVANGSLKALENRLKDYGFARIHDSHIINQSFIRTFIREKSDAKVILKNDLEFEVSRTKKANILALYDGSEK